MENNRPNHSILYNVMAQIHLNFLFITRAIYRSPNLKKLATSTKSNLIQIFLGSIYIYEKSIDFYRGRAMFFVLFYLTFLTFHAKLHQIS